MSTSLVSNYPYKLPVVSRLVGIFGTTNPSLGPNSHGKDSRIPLQRKHHMNS